MHRAQCSYILNSTIFKIKIKFDSDHIKIKINFDYDGRVRGYDDIKIKIKFDSDHIKIKINFDSDGRVRGYDNIKIKIIDFYMEGQKGQNYFIQGLGHSCSVL